MPFPKGFPAGSDGKVSARNVGRFDPWDGKIPWRRKWQPTPVLLFRKFHGWRSLVGYSPWSCKELDKSDNKSVYLIQQVFVLSIP